MLLSGLQLRNLYIGEGYDAVIRLMLLWVCFTNAGAAWSVDAGGRGSRSLVRDVGAVGIYVQVCAVYFCAGWAKVLVPEWQTGQAVWLHMHHDFFVTGFGDLLRGVPALTTAMNHLTLALELGLPLLLLLPWARVRTAVIGFTILWTFGFWLALDVGLFPFASTVALCALLPAPTLDRLEQMRGFQWLSERARQ